MSSINLVKFDSKNSPTDEERYTYWYKKYLEPKLEELYYDKFIDYIDIFEGMNNKNQKFIDRATKELQSNNWQVRIREETESYSNKYKVKKYRNYTVFRIIRHNITTDKILNPKQKSNNDSDSSDDESKSE